MKLIQTPNTFKPVHRLLLIMFGGGLLLVGTAMLVLPGPGIVLIFLGLALLAREFRWAKRAHASTKRIVVKARCFIRRIISFIRSKINPQK